PGRGDRDLQGRAQPRRALVDGDRRESAGRAPADRRAPAHLHGIPNDGARRPDRTSTGPSLPARHGCRAAAMGRGGAPPRTPHPASSPAPRGRVMRNLALLIGLPLIPGVELRGTIPVGIAMGYHPLWVMAVAIVTNCVLVVPTFMALDLLYARWFPGGRFSADRSIACVHRAARMSSAMDYRDWLCSSPSRCLAPVPTREHCWRG